MMRVLLTRPPEDSVEFARALGKLGFEAVLFPTIAIHPVKDTSILDRALGHLQDYDWLVFTSANAVDAVLDRKTALGIETLPQHLRIAAIGPKTAARLLDHGVIPEFTPAEYIAEAIVPGLDDLAGRRVLLPLADIAHDTLPRAIRDAKGIAHVVTAYHTLPTAPDAEVLSAIRRGIDIITFTSGSTARNFVAIVQAAGLNPFLLPGSPAIACIGPKTARAARELGFSVDIVASEYTVEGLVLAISSRLHPFEVDDQC